MAEALVSKWPHGSNKKSAQEARTSKSKTESSEMKMTPARGKTQPKCMWHTETHREQKEEANLNKNTKTDSSQKKTADRTYKISE
jgi:hypothetical protein